jgi:guanylate kinase
VLSLKKSHLNPRYIFITVPNEDSLHQRFRQRLALAHPEVPSCELEDIYNNIMKSGIANKSAADFSGYNEVLRTEIGQWLIRAEAAFNNEYNIADFFDFKIINDNLEKAYSELKEYCLGVYLDNTDDD